MALKLSDLRNTAASSLPKRPDLPPETTVTGILKVREPNYVPRYVTLRQRIDDRMFTASFRVRDLEALEADAAVESVALSQPLALIADQKVSG